MKIPDNKVLSETQTGTRIISIRRKYISDLNQICCLDSNYEYNYALYLDYLYSTHQITGWIRNTTAFGLSEAVEVPGKASKTQNSYVPDFIVFNLDGTYEIHEVKGWMNERSKAVITQFRKDYPNLAYKIIGKTEIIVLQREFQDKLWGWVKIR